MHSEPLKCAGLLVTEAARRSCYGDDYTLLDVYEDARADDHQNCDIRRELTCGTAVGVCRRLRLIGLVVAIDGGPAVDPNPIAGSRAAPALPTVSGESLML